MDFSCVFFLLISPQFAVAKAKNLQEGTASIKEEVKGLTRMKGFFDLYWDQEKGRLLLQIDDLGNEFIYQSSSYSNREGSRSHADQSAPGE